jgi:hypothetical protein
MSASFLYNGTRSMYEQAGWRYDRPKGQFNCVMVTEVAPRLSRAGRGAMLYDSCKTERCE